MNITILATTFITLTAFSITTPLYAATQLGNTTQKGSLLIFPRIETFNTTNTVDGVTSDTLIHISNDASVPVNLQCTWGTTEGSPYNTVGGNTAATLNAGHIRKHIRNNHYTSFSFTLPKNYPAFFWAGDLDALATHQYNSHGVNMLNFKIKLPKFNDFQDGYQASAGELICWAINAMGDQEIHHNHLTGNATVLKFAADANPNNGQAHNYNAISFQAHYHDNQQQYAPNSIQYTSKPLPTPGIINLDGNEYDSCPNALAGQFIPTKNTAWQSRNKTTISIVNCHQDLSADNKNYITQLTYNVWNASQVKYTGAHDCMGAWYESDLGAEFSHFTYKSLRTNSAYFRVQPAKSALCNQGNQKKAVERDIEVSGLVGIQVNDIGGAFLTSSSLTGLSAASTPANQITRKDQILWDISSGDMGKQSN